MPDTTAQYQGFLTAPIGATENHKLDTLEVLLTTSQALDLIASLAKTIADSSNGSPRILVTLLGTASKVDFQSSLDAEIIVRAK